MFDFPKDAQWISGPEYDYGADGAGYYADHRNHILVGAFELDAVPVKSTLGLAVLGYARVTVNGSAVSGDELVGDWTNYAKLVTYRTYEVAGLLVAGANEVRIELGNGFYNPSPLRLFGKYSLRERLAEVGTPKALLAIVDNEGNALLKSDSSWGYTLGNLTFNNVYLGERADLRLAESELQPVPVTLKNDRNLESATVSSIRAFDSVDGADVRSARMDGRDVLIVDFRQMVEGFVDLEVMAREGDVVRVRYAETVDEKGTPDFGPNLAGMVGATIPKAGPNGTDLVVPGGPGAPDAAVETDVITCREGLNRFRNTFTLHSFRYAVVEGVTADALRAIKATYVHTDLAQVGTLSMGNDWLDALHDAAVRTKLNNVHGVWEDCAREHLGYGGDMVALAASNLLSFDAEGLIRKTVRDFRNDQTANGGVPETAPYVGIQSMGTGEGEGPLLWQVAYPFLVLRAYQWYGARDLVEGEWPHVRRLVDYLLSRDPEELAAHCLGDHGSVQTGTVNEGDWKGGTTDRDFTSWCAILWFARMAQDFCRILGEDGAAYAQADSSLASLIRERFQNADGSFGNGTQTSYAFAAYFGLMDQQVAGDAIAGLMAEQDDVLSAGIFGASFAWDILHETGHDDAVERWLLREGEPSYKTMLAAGNGALAEQFHMADGSYDHAMFSSYVQWMYHALAGIRVARDAVAADHVVVSPHFSTLTDHVKARLALRGGEVSTSWDRQADGSIRLAVKASEGVRVDVVMPSGYEAKASNNFASTNQSYDIVAGR